MSLKLGVVTRSFPELTHAQTAELLAKAGCCCTELCLISADTKYWVYNGRSDMSTLSDDDFLRIVNTYRAAGIEVTSLGVFSNMIHPDDEELKQIIAYYERHMQLAAYAGIKYISTECGFTPHQRGINTDRYEFDFDRLKSTLTTLCGLGDKYDVDIALETCVIDVVPSAKRARDLIAQIGSKRLKVLLDPANLIANSSEEDMFRYLSEHVAYFHGKDRKVNDAKGRVIGDGEIDWRLFLSLYHKYNDGMPFILEYVNSSNYLEILERVRKYEASL